MKHTEKVPFRFIAMECCGHPLCWIGPRLPNHCPECGVPVYPAVRSWITFNDQTAILQYSTTSREHVYVPKSALGGISGWWV